MSKRTYHEMAEHQRPSSCAGFIVRPPERAGASRGCVDERPYQKAKGAEPAGELKERHEVKKERRRSVDSVSSPVVHNGDGQEGTRPQEEAAISSI